MAEIALPLPLGLVETVWRQYNAPGLGDLYQQGQVAYCLVRGTSGLSGQKLFQSVGVHAEVNMINALKPQCFPRIVNNHYQQLPNPNPPTILHIYLNCAPCGPVSPGMNCAGELQKFSQDYNVMLHIKAVDPYLHNENALYQLMTSPYVKLSAFTKEDWRDLAALLGYPLPPNWIYEVDRSARDIKTANKFYQLAQFNNAVMTAHSYNVQ